MRLGDSRLTFDLVGIGNPVYDMIETPSVKTDGRVLSGCSTNACLTARKLGMNKVGLIGRIGRDFGVKFDDDMKKYGIEVAKDQLTGETGGFRLIYDEHGDRTLDVLGVAGPITPRNVPERFLDASFFVIGPILGEVDLGLVEFLRSSSSAKLFLDPQGLLRVIGADRRIIHTCDREVFRKVVGLVDFIKPNEPESQTITGKMDPVQAIKQLSQMGPAVPIVTLAEKGSILLNGGELARIPAYPTKAIDPTGAGDTYAGSFITEYARTKDLVESALFASAASSIMVEQVGPDFVLQAKAVRERKESIRGRLVIDRLA
jgi:sugar/nucleoside kinase (ribokinase family)